MPIVLHLRARIKKKFQPIADLIGVYGWGAAAGRNDGPVLGGYAVTFGLYLNIRRTELRRAGCVADGIAAAFEPAAAVLGAQSENEADGQQLAATARARAMPPPRAVGGGFAA